MAPARGHTCCVVLDRLLHAGAGNAHCGRESKEDTDTDRGDQGPEKRCRVEMNSREQRQGYGALVRKVVDDGEGDGESDDRTKERQDETLCEQLADQASAACAKCTAHGELFAARGGAA